MPLIFSNEQIKNMTLGILELPLIIDNPVDGTGLIQQKQKAILDKDSVYASDQQNKIFSDFWISNIQKYHDELVLLNSEVRALYDVANIDTGGQQIDPHYTGTWPNLVPILIPSNNGNPRSTTSGNELSKISPIQDSIGFLKNGFNDGALNTTLNTSYVAGSGTISLFSGILTAGQRVLITSGTSFLFAVVGSSSGSCSGEIPVGSGTTEALCISNGGIWTATTSITPLSPDIDMPNGSTVTTFHSGFTNSQRGYQSGWAGNNYQTWLETDIDLKLGLYLSHISAQNLAVSSNEDNDGARKLLNQNEISLLQATIDDSNTWLGSLIANVNGKYTDNGLSLITDQFALRIIRIPLRAIEISDNLGILIQAADGVVSGSGAYFNLWEIILVRISKAGGTLVSWYGASLGITLFATKIANAESTLVQYNNVFAVSSILGDTVIGDIEFNVDSVVDFSTGQQVKILDNNSIIYDRTISSITGNLIRLDSGIPVALLVGDKARMIRVK